MFYDIFEQLCASKNIKPNTATKALGLSSATATNWKTSGRIPNGETLARIADYFNCSVDYLLGRTDTPDADSSLKAHSDESQGLSSEFMFNSVKQRENAQKKPAPEAGNELSGIDAELYDLLMGLPDDKLQDAMRYVRYLKSLPDNE